MIKLIKFTALALLLTLTVQCNSTKIISINSEVAIIKATSTPITIQRAPGARLDFTILNYKDVTLSSVYYWEKQNALTIVKQNGDTVWAKAEIAKPNFAREMKESNISPDAVRPPDTTCVLNYTFNGESLKIPVSYLKKGK